MCFTSFKQLGLFQEEMVVNAITILAACILWGRAITVVTNYTVAYSSDSSD